MDGWIDGWMDGWMDGWDSPFWVHSSRGPSEGPGRKAGAGDDRARHHRGTGAVHVRDDASQKGAEPQATVALDIHLRGKDTQ